MKMNFKLPFQDQAERKLQNFGRRMGVNGAKFVRDIKTKGIHPADDNAILGKK